MYVKTDIFVLTSLSNATVAAKVGVGHSLFHILPDRIRFTFVRLNIVLTIFLQLNSITNLLIVVVGIRVFIIMRRGVASDSPAAVSGENWLGFDRTLTAAKAGMTSVEIYTLIKLI